MRSIGKRGKLLCAQLSKGDNGDNQPTFLGRPNKIIQFLVNISEICQKSSKDADLGIAFLFLLTINIF